MSGRCFLAPVVWQRVGSISHSGIGYWCYTVDHRTLFHPIRCVNPSDRHYLMEVALARIEQLDGGTTAKKISKVRLIKIQMK